MHLLTFKIYTYINHCEDETLGSAKYGRYRGLNREPVAGLKICTVDKTKVEIECVEE
jgi:hypothetical protein